MDDDLLNNPPTKSGFFNFFANISNCLVLNAVCLNFLCQDISCNDDCIVINTSGIFLIENMEVIVVFLFFVASA